MSESNDHLNKDAERGLPDGLGAENTQPGPAMIHTVEPESLVFGLGSAETQGDVTDAVLDHADDDAARGLPLGLGSQNTQDGPAVPHPFEPDATAFGLGSPETQHAHAV